MTMRMSVKQLRRVILHEMKLGVAGSYTSGEAWGVKDEPEQYSPPEGGETYIATEEPINYEPDELTKSLYRGRGGYDMAGDPVAKDAAESEWEMVDDEELEPDATRPRSGTRRMEAKRLRQIIREELTAEPDPFADPGKKKPGNLKGLAQNVMKAEELMGSMPQVLGDMENSTQIPKVKAMLKKGAGLAYHALNDLKALEAILTIAVKAMRQN